MTEPKKRPETPPDPNPRNADDPRWRSEFPNGDPLSGKRGEGPDPTHQFQPPGGDKPPSQKGKNANRKAKGRDNDRAKT